MDRQIPEENLSSSQEGRAYLLSHWDMGGAIAQGRHLREDTRGPPFSSGNPNNANPGTTSLSTAHRGSLNPPVRVKAEQFVPAGSWHPGLQFNPSSIPLTPSDLILHSTLAKLKTTYKPSEKVGKTSSTRAWLAWVDTMPGRNQLGARKGCMRGSLVPSDPGLVLGKKKASLPGVFLC